MSTTLHSTRTNARSNTSVGVLTASSWRRATGSPESWRSGTPSRGTLLRQLVAPEAETLAAWPGVQTASGLRPHQGAVTTSCGSGVPTGLQARNWTVLMERGWLGPTMAGASSLPGAVSVTVWDAASGRRLQLAKIHDERLTDMVFCQSSGAGVSPAALRIAPFRCYEATTGKGLSTLVVHRLPAGRYHRCPGPALDERSPRPRRNSFYYVEAGRRLYHALQPRRVPQALSHSCARGVKELSRAFGPEEREVYCSDRKRILGRRLQNGVARSDPGRCRSERFLARDQRPAAGP